MKWSILVPLIICGIYCIVVIVIAAVERGEKAGEHNQLNGHGKEGSAPEYDEPDREIRRAGRDVDRRRFQRLALPGCRASARYVSS